MKIHSILYDTNYINLKFASESSSCRTECCQDVNKEKYTDGIEWALVGKKSSIYDHVEFTGDDYKFQVVNYSFTVRRKARWMTVYMMLPCIVVTILAACVFCLPANSCEKTTLATTVLIITTFFLTILPKVSPQSSMERLWAKELLFSYCFLTVFLGFFWRFSDGFSDGFLLVCLLFFLLFSSGSLMVFLLISYGFLTDFFINWPNKFFFDFDTDFLGWFSVQKIKKHKNNKKSLLKKTVRKP